MRKITLLLILFISLLVIWCNNEEKQTSPQANQNEQQKIKEPDTITVKDGQRVIQVWDRNVYQWDEEEETPIQEQAPEIKEWLPESLQEYSFVIPKWLKTYYYDISPEQIKEVWIEFDKTKFEDIWKIADLYISLFAKLDWENINSLLGDPSMVKMDFKKDDKRIWITILSADYYSLWISRLFAWLKEEKKINNIIVLVSFDWDLSWWVGSWEDLWN